jgi:hypothetical protein
MSNFENDLKNKFEGVEFSPSDQLWAGIEAGIIPRKKKGVFFYWTTYGIAAGLALLLTLGFLLRDNFTSEVIKPESIAKEEPKEQIESEPTVIKDSTNVQNPLMPTKSQQLTANGKSIYNSNSDLKNPINALIGDDLVILNSSSKSLITQEAQNSTQGANQISDDTANQFSNLEITLPNLPISILILKARWEAKNTIVKMPINSNILIEEPFERLMAVNGGIGSGSFNPNANGDPIQANVQLQNENGLTANSNSVVRNDKNVQTGAFAVGAGFDLALSRQWTLHIGLRYAEFNFENTSNAYSVENNQLLPVYLPTGYKGELIYVDNYNITNSISSLALPIQMAYSVLELGKLNVDVRAGLSADYFLRYRVKGDLPILDNRIVNFKESSLFNRFNLGGIVGLGVNYKLNEQWGLSADFFARQYLRGVNELTGYSSSPLIYGFSFNLRYFIKKED